MVPAIVISADIGQIFKMVISQGGCTKHAEPARSLELEGTFAVIGDRETGRPGWLGGWLKSLAWWHSLVRDRCLQDANLRPTDSLLDVVRAVRQDQQRKAQN